jgi:ATP-grasp ribosomal peptide maturase
VTDAPGAVLVVTGRDSTADLVIEQLLKRDVTVARLDFVDFPDQLSVTARYDADNFSGVLETPSREIDLRSVTAVYYRRPNWPTFEGLPKQDARFAKDQFRFGIAGAIAALPGCLQVNHPRLQAAAEYKPAQLRVAGEMGFAVPPTIVTNRLDDARAFIASHGVVVYKPLWPTEYQAEGGLQTIWVRAVDPGDLDESLRGTAHLFQARVDKTADVRVTVVGDQIFCVRIDSPLTDWRERYDLIERYTVIEPPSGLDTLLRTYLDRFGLYYGCFDFGIDALDETWWFYECNPAGEWGWLAHETPLPIAEAFADTLMKREGRTA